ncbi:bile acid:sodium symporter family protein [Hymenobacter actinosclerus]|uniref:Solute carrier family 10 (Sodium/bile acid cotransporter), member 7 n=1 Tax=Hymenobacter actinosclerus TaxID=82805 RepID=A0A1I0EQK1_9BACT|nr:bile acid:sodium symporter family protein [Hymenobacter actinosclerus]SET47785.1 solute carrier family 10 (sodium/bile acid cotransporter), member 7 [Hymenobacter actinosclerus]
MPQPVVPTTSPALPENRLIALLRRAGLLDWFLPALAAVVGLAYLAPGLGGPASPLPWDALNTVGVALVFFLYGLKLSIGSLRDGNRNWRLHLVVQATTFLLFPLLALVARPLFGAGQGPLLWQSIFFLCVLPSTVSTSVVMVSMGRGNVPAAIFNASLSALLGIALTPLWVRAVLQPTGSGTEGLGALALSLAWQVVLPVGAGLLLNPRFGEWAGRQKARLRVLDQVVILSIVYTSFCESFAGGVFRSYAPATVALLGLGMVGLYFAVFGLVAGASRLLGFPAADRTTAIFCGSKKSLVHGSVFASLLFPDSGATGALLLPLMLYHALQIVLASIMAQQFGQAALRAEALAETRAGSPAAL